MHSDIVVSSELKYLVNSTEQLPWSGEAQCSFGWNVRELVSNDKDLMMYLKAPEQLFVGLVVRFFS